MFLFFFFSTHFLFSFVLPLSLCFVEVAWYLSIYLLRSVINGFRSRTCPSTPSPIRYSRTLPRLSFLFSTALCIGRQAALFALPNLTDVNVSCLVTGTTLGCLHVYLNIPFFWHDLLFLSGLCVSSFALPCNHCRLKFLCFVGRQHPSIRDQLTNNNIHFIYPEKLPGKDLSHGVVYYLTSTVWGLSIQRVPCLVHRLFGVLNHTRISHLIRSTYTFNRQWCCISFIRCSYW